MPKPLDFSREDAIRWITDLFNERVKGKKPKISNSNVNHDGKGGHWLEEQMGLKKNSNNKPDIFNFEMKNNTTSKTTFGDWSPDYFIFRSKLKNKTSSIDRKEFFKIFGRSNPDKAGRYSWSGEPFPKFGGYNTYGQILTIDKFQNIVAVYNFAKDMRSNKLGLVPKEFQRTDVVLARWDAEKIKAKFQRKFSEFGWFKCYQNDDGFYDRIVFGKKIDYTFFLEQLIEKNIYLDCGMFDGNARPYMSWRCSNKVWSTFQTDEETRISEIG